MTSTDEPSSIGRRYLPWGLLAVFLLVAAAIFFSRRAALAAPQQPIPFSHQRHSTSGIQCTYCHTSALRSDIAGVPSVAKCIGCHQTIAVGEPTIQMLTGYWERQEPIPWQPVTAHSDLVYFSHQAHVTNAVSCEACHGPVGTMDQTRPVEDMDMGFCLNCHLQQPEEKVGRLADCLACHK